MSKSRKEANAPLLDSVSQFEVDFVIPRVGKDLAIGIDPFLLFKSRDPFFAELHNTILKGFNKGLEFIKNNKDDKALALFDFPEASEIGLGYAQTGKRGAGVGDFLSGLIIETLRGSPNLLQRGVRHIEELQLFSVGIGPDRVSDICANLIKLFLIEYTQKQCKLWDIPLVPKVPISHVFDPQSHTWFDDYFNLPLSPFDKTPILLVPRRIVRTLPWINYDDFFRMEFSAYLRAKKVRKSLSSKPTEPTVRSKKDVVAVTRKEIERVDRYVSAKEASAHKAQPSLTYLDKKAVCKETELLKAKLKQINCGKKDATKYQYLILEILNFLFNPELIDGTPEVRTVDGTERRDIIFTNDSDFSFWSYLRQEHSSIFLMFEAKNVSQLENSHFNQTATYLGDRLGRLGVIVTRHPLKPAQEKKAFSIYNDSHPRKLILVFCDDDISYMLDMKCKDNDPMKHVQKLYRNFRTRVQ